MGNEAARCTEAGSFVSLHFLCHDDSGIRGMRAGVMTELELLHYRAFGFVVLRGACDAGRLRAELLQALTEGVTSTFGADVGTGEINGQYVPMMIPQTSYSLALLDTFAPAAAALLGGDVLPVRAKGIRYFGSTPWHTDSDHAVASVGFAAYLEPVDAASGALRVIPGSHHTSAAAMRAYLTALGPDTPVAALPGVAITTQPGDVIAFDEHLLHASSGGTTRCQWRVDYLLDPQSAAAERNVHQYFASTFPPDWDGGYDVDKFPSYGAHWRDSQRPANDRLRALGIYPLVDAQESFARKQRRQS